MTDYSLTLAPILVDADDAAALLGVSRGHFLNMDRSGRLGPQPIKLGRCTRWSRAELERWAEVGCPTRSEWTAMQEHGDGG